MYSVDYVAYSVDYMDYMAYSVDYMAYSADSMAYSTDSVAYTTDSMAYSADSPGGRSRHRTDRARTTRADTPSSQPRSAANTHQRALRLQRLSGAGGGGAAG